IGSYYQAVINSGDTNFNSPGHHGTPQERLAAARLGVEAGFYVIQTRQGLSYVELHEAFTSTIRSLSLPPDDVSLAGGSDLVRHLNQSEARAIARGETNGSDLPPLGPGSPDLFPRP